MLTRRLAFVALLFSIAMMAWAKDAITPQSLMAKSDAIYYTPSARGITDLAVDITIDQLQQDPTTKDALLTYYNADGNRHLLDIMNIPESKTALRNSLLSMTNTVQQHVMPALQSSSFTGMPVRLTRVILQLAGVKETHFYQLSATFTGADEPVKELRVLLDKDGLLYQLESRLQDGSQLIANIENIHSNYGWHIATITTRIAANKDVYWRIDHTEYAEVDGFMLPSRFTMQYRDSFNQPELGATDIAVSFSNYRINTGVAAKMLDRAAAEQPAPTTPETK